MPANLNHSYCWAKRGQLSQECVERRKKVIYLVLLVKIYFQYGISWLFNTVRTGVRNLCRIAWTVGSSARDEQILAGGFSAGAHKWLMDLRQFRFPLGRLLALVASEAAWSSQSWQVLQVPLSLIPREKMIMQLFILAENRINESFVLL